MVRIPIEGVELSHLTLSVAGGLTLLERRFQRWPRWLRWLRYTREVALPAQEVEWDESALRPVEGRPALTVLTLNVWHDWPRFRLMRQRLERLAQLVEQHDVDVLFLQEVPRLGRAWSDVWLAERLGMARVYLRANGAVRDGQGFAEGVALLSRYPLTSPQGLILHGNLPFIHRAAVGAWVHTPWGRVWAVSVHTSVHPKRQRQQAQQLLAWVDQVAGERPALIAGDFNGWERHPGIRFLRSHWLDLFRERHTDRPVRTFAFRLPFVGEVGWRLDYIFLRPGQGQGWRPLTVQVLRPSAFISDHLPLLARLAPHALAHPQKMEAEPNTAPRRREDTRPRRAGASA